MAEPPITTKYSQPACSDNHPARPNAAALPPPRRDQRRRPPTAMALHPGARYARLSHGAASQLASNTPARRATAANPALTRQPFFFSGGRAQTAR